MLNKITVNVDVKTQKQALDLHNSNINDTYTSSINCFIATALKNMGFKDFTVDSHYVTLFGGTTYIILDGKGKASYIQNKVKKQEDFTVELKLVKEF